MGEASCISSKEGSAEGSAFTPLSEDDQKVVTMPIYFPEEDVASSSTLRKFLHRLNTRNCWFAQRLEHAEQLKQEGNKLYAENDTEGAVVSPPPAVILSVVPPKRYTVTQSWQCVELHSITLDIPSEGCCQGEFAMQAKYEEALQTAPEASTKQRAVYYANLAACHLKCKQFEDAVQDSTAALELDPSYVKALMRRSAAYEELDDLEHALSDSQKVPFLAHTLGQRVEENASWSDDAVMSTICSQH